MKAGARLTGKLPSFAFPAKQAQVSVIPDLFMSVQGNGGFPRAEVRGGMLFLMQRVGELHPPFSKACLPPASLHEAGSDGDRSNPAAKP